jgi:anti-sigma B factor antagonist
VSESSTPPPDVFSCEVSRNGSSAWVHPAGDLDLDTVHRVESALADLRREGCGNLVLDLRGLTFMDSTGLRLVIRWHTAAEDEGFRFAVVPGPEVVQRVFRLTGMDAHLMLAEPPAGD